MYGNFWVQYFSWLLSISCCIRDYTVFDCYWPCQKTCQKLLFYKAICLISRTRENVVVSMVYKDLTAVLSSLSAVRIGFLFWLLHYFRFWRELRLNKFFKFKYCLFYWLHYFRFWRELRHYGRTLAVVILPNGSCTISVFEGNYDKFYYSAAFYICYTSLHYFRFWRELRPDEKFFLSKNSFLVALFPFLKGITTFTKNNFAVSNFKNSCTISVFEGNYDLDCQLFYSLFSPSFSCTISVFEGNYDDKNLADISIKTYIRLHYFRFWRELRPESFRNFKKAELNVLHYFRFWRELRPIFKVFWVVASNFFLLHYFRFWRELRHNILANFEVAFI